MKSNQRITLTKRLLRESLIELMEKKDIQKISVSELCKSAGINRTTFYNHYYTPYDILKEIEEDMIKEMDNILTIENPKNTLLFKKRIEKLCSYLRENSKTSKLLFKNNPVDSEFAKKLFLLPKEKLSTYKYFSDDYDKSSQMLIVAFLENGIYSLIQYWLLNDIEKTPKEMSDLIYDIAINGWVNR